MNLEFTITDDKGVKRPARAENVYVNQLSANNTVCFDDISCDAYFYQTDDYNWVEPADSWLNDNCDNQNQVLIALKEYGVIGVDINIQLSYPSVEVVINKNEVIKSKHIKENDYSYLNAGWNEPLFTLRGNDNSSGATVLMWIMLNYDNLNCPNSKLEDAFECVMEMRNYKFTHGKNAD